MLEISTGIGGLFLRKGSVIHDRRGSFLKTFQKSGSEVVEATFVSREEYYSISNKDVVRGLHFQLPPNQHKKEVYCTHGKALDVVVDLRLRSPTYGRVEAFELSHEKGFVVMIPEGCAHGFLSLQDETIMMYRVSSTYNPESDSGILWNSIDYDWGIQAPILSERDCGFASFSSFRSPF